MFVFFHFPHWFFFTGMICTVALPSLVHHYWAWFVLFHVMLRWVFITGHGLG
jgi:hypothetical protein